MNKLFTKIATFSVGLAMAIGVGVVVGAGSKDAVPVHATSNTVTFTMAGFNESSTSVSAATNYEGTGAISGGGTVAAIARNFNTSNGQIRGNQTSVASNWSLWNTAEIPGPITGISISATGTFQNNLYAAMGTTSSQGSATSGTAGGTSPRFTWSFPASSGYRYFKLLSSQKFTNGTVTAAVVTVTYDVVYSVSYNANGGTGTMTDSSSPYNSGSTVTVKANSFTAPSGKIFDHWDTKADDSGTDYNPADTFTITADTTLYAQWEELSDDPYVIISSPIAGYTGQEPDVSFSYGNFTSTLSITSSDKDVVEISDIDIADPSNSAVTLSYVGAGSVDVYFKDGVGGTTIATLVITVTQTAITGMPSTNSVKMGETLNLGALVSVNVGGLTWDSSVPEKATVDSSGVVTPVAIGTTTITVTSAVDSSVSASCTVTVEKASPAVTDEITRSDLDFGSSTGYSNFTTSKSSNATYVGQAFQTATGYIQIRTSGSVEGLVSTASGGKRVKSVTIDFNKSSNAAIQIYGNNNAYSGSNAANLFSNTESVKGTMVQEIEYSESAVTYTFTSDYKYIGIRSNSGAAYLDSVSIIWELYSADEVASNIKTMAGGWNNDTETNQCSDHYQKAKEMILLMSSSELDDFKTNNEDNDIKSARATYEWWCHINGDDSPWSGAIVQNAKGNFANFAIGETNSAAIIIIVISVVSLTAVGGYFLLKKKKEQ